MIFRALLTGNQFIQPTTFIEYFRTNYILPDNVQLNYFFLYRANVDIPVSYLAFRMI